MAAIPPNPMPAHPRGQFYGHKSMFTEPFFLQWHTTDRCNLACKHCYRGEPLPELPLADKFQILSRFIRLLEFFKIKGRLQFGGGEPFLDPDLLPLIQQCDQHSIPVRIFSNGTVIDETILNALKKTSCRLIQISIEGTEAVNDAIRGAGSFKKALTGARLCKASDMEVTFSVTLHQSNLGCIDDVLNLSNGFVDRVHFGRLVPLGTGAELKEALLTKSQYKKVLQKIRAVKDQLKVQIPLRDPLWRGFFMSYQKGQHCRAVTGCSAGYNQFSIEPNGDVYPCRRLPLKIGNALEDDLAALYRHPVMENLRNRATYKGKCQKCPLLWQCGGCRGIAYALTGDYLNEDPQCFWKKIDLLNYFTRRGG